MSSEPQVSGVVPVGEVVAAYAAGKPVPAIAGWFGISEDEVHRLVALGVGPDVAPAEVPVPVQEAARPRWRLITFSVLALLGLASLGAVIVWSGSGEGGMPPPVPVVASGADQLQAAKDGCARAESGVEITDGGSTMLFDGRGTEDFFGAPFEALACIQEKLKMPAAVVAHIGATRALDGRQQDSWDGFTASWSYHPDNGTDLIIQVD